MRAQLSLEFLAVTALVFSSLPFFFSLIPSLPGRDGQAEALLIDDLASLGAPFESDAVLVGVECRDHVLLEARTLAGELVMGGGYRYRTHCIKGPVFP